MATHNSKDFVACAARTMKSVLNGTAVILQLWSYRKRDLDNWLNGKMVLHLKDLLRLFAIARVANPKIRLNLIPNRLQQGNVMRQLKKTMRHKNNI